jgi:putative acetyltransferase
MDIHAARPSDQTAIQAVVAAAFEEEPGGRVVTMIRALNETRATRVSLVADDHGIVGHVQLSRAWIDARATLVEALMLTPLSVVPGRQHQGVGRRLLDAALIAADLTGAAAVVLEGDWEYYGRRGFVPAGSLGLLRPSLRIPERAFQVATLSPYESWMTGQVVYPDAVWQTDVVGLRDPLLERVEKALGS